MTLAHWCVLAAAILPYLFTGLAKSRGDFDNARPREWLARVGGWRQRAHWAQLNGFEAFPAFAAAVLVAEQVGAAQGAVDTLAAVFVLARVAHGGFYVADWHPARSLAFLLGLACTVGLFVAAALG